MDYIQDHVHVVQVFSSSAKISSNNWTGLPYVADEKGLALLQLFPTTKDIILL